MKSRIWMALFLSILSSAPVVAQEKDPENYPITLMRTASGDCITGTIMIGGQPVCATFESGGSKISIPAGNYIAVIRQNPKLKRVMLEIPKLNGAIIRLGDFPANANNHVNLAETLKGCATESIASSVKGYEALTMALKKGDFTAGQKVSLAVTLQ